MVFDNPVKNYLIVAGVILFVLILKKVISRYFAGLIYRLVNVVFRDVDKRSFADLVAKLPFEATPAQAALAWVAQQEGVTTVIPGARTVAQARANAAAGELPPLGPEFMDGVRELYDRELRAQVHDRW